MRSLAAREPAAVTGGVMGLFGAVVTVLTAFGVIHLDGGQIAALAGLAVIVLPPLQGLVTRQFVRPVELSEPVGTGRHAAPPENQLPPPP